jgi:protoporphyrinogen oxidase
VSSKWEGRAPAGHVLLRAYLGGAHDPDAVDLTDDEMADVALRELSAILSTSAKSAPSSTPWSSAPTRPRC